MSGQGAGQVELGRSGVKVSEMGVGTMLWTSNSQAAEADVRRAYQACVDNGLTFFDTAEVYGNGTSERMLGACIQRDGRKVAVASKFAPPSRMMPIQPKRRSAPRDSPQVLTEALDGSLRRLGVEYLDLYQMHVPPPDNTMRQYMDVMADAVEAGQVRAIGVCNFSESQIREAHAALAARGVPLSTSMVGYNILRRWPESNGVFAACEELGVSVIPYAPLAEGVLTGKYRVGAGRRVPLSYVVALYFGHLDITKDHDDSKSLLRRAVSRPRELDKRKMEPLFEAMDEVGRAHGRTLAQVAINWLLTNEEVSVLPIPGMRSPRQVEDNLGALGWRLSHEERLHIERAEERARN
jgi:aryl-alcohol dehydrogenase-like predicted oxidoreductase